MDGDKFISTQKSIKKIRISDDDNFFLQTENLGIRPLEQEPLRHLNDYDSNILKQDAYKEVDDVVFRLEYKITQTEQELNELNQQLQAAIEINEYTTAENLQIRKNQKESELQDLINAYNEISISAKISGSVTSKMKTTWINTKNILSKFGERFLSKFPGKISSFIEIRNSLSKLENINKSVDELMGIQYPYGEATDKYEQLSKYIARANSIQSEISKFIK